MHRYGQLAITLILTVMGVSSAGASESQDGKTVKNYSPKIDNTNPTQVYWGDTHLHTKLSVDAYLNSNRTLGPEEAYLFAQGKDIKTHDGRSVRLGRPLDFLVIVDHGMGRRFSLADTPRCGV